jgi:hypothetical protein
MQKLKPVLLFIVLFGLTIFPVLYGRAERQALKRIRRGVNEAEAMLPRGDMGLPAIERLASSLRAVDSTRAPEPVRAALSNYTAAVERHEASVRQTGIWTTNTAWAIGEAQQQFRKALTR